jgi:hypothetical protein
MSEGVDLSQIRGDWKFHMDFVQNATEQTLKRQLLYWNDLGDNADIDESVKQQQKLWAELQAGANDKGTISTTGGTLGEFIVACRGSKDLCDVYQDQNDSELAEEFAEACRQVRGLSDDLEMMKDQRPDDL